MHGTGVILWKILWFINWRFVLQNSVVPDSLYKPEKSKIEFYGSYPANLKIAKVSVHIMHNDKTVCIKQEPKGPFFRNHWYGRGVAK